MVAQFVTAFLVTARVLAMVMGGASAVVLACLGVLTVILLADAAFDFVTSALANRWAKNGKKPRSRLGRIIARSKDGSAV